MSKDQFISSIFAGGGAVLVAFDDSSISGPELALRQMDKALKSAVAGGADAVLGLYGMFKRYGEIINKTPGFMNVTLSTEGPHHLRKVLVGSAEQAKRLNVGVSVHLNTSAPTESEMLSILGQTAAVCDELEIALLAHVYPRRILDGKEDHYDKLKAEDKEAYAALVRHGARIAADLGADIIKVPFTGSEESFRSVIESVYGLPVLMAAGPKIPLQGILSNTETAMQAGAKGVAVGRNFFKREKGKEVVCAFRAVVHDGKTVNQAMRSSALLLGD